MKTADAIRMNKDKAANRPGRMMMIAVAVRQGKFQVQKVTYNDRGVSTILPLTNWVSKETAYIVKAGLTGHPRPSVCHICGKEYPHCRCGWGGSK